MPLFGFLGKPDVYKLKSKQDVDGLIKAMAYRRDIMVRMDAIRAAQDLATQIKDAEKITRLWKAVVDRVQVETSYSVGETLEPAFFAILERINNVPPTSKSVSMITSVMSNSGDVEARALAARTLGAIADNIPEQKNQALLDAIPHLHKAFQQGSDKLQQDAATGLALMAENFTDPGALQSIADILLQGTNASVKKKRSWSIQGIGAAAARSTDPVLSRRLIGELSNIYEKNPKARISVALAFEAIGKTNQDPDVLSVVIKSLQNAFSYLSVDTDDSVLIAMSAIAEKHPHHPDMLAAIDDLVALMGHEKSDFRGVSASTIVKIGTPAVPALIMAMESDNSVQREIVIRMLDRIGDPRAIPVYIRALEDANERVRGNATWTLKRLIDKADEALDSVHRVQIEEALARSSQS